MKSCLHLLAFRRPLGHLKTERIASASVRDVAQAAHKFEPDDLQDYPALVEHIVADGGRGLRTFTTSILRHFRVAPASESLTPLGQRLNVLRYGYVIVPVA